MSWRLFALWVGSSAMLHLAWETAQLPLYALYREATRGQIAYAIAHCTAGDVLIAAGAYGIASIAVRTTAWPLRKPLTGTAVAIAAAVAYTGFSEWLNVYVRESWAYSDWMPQVLGIGISPILQWLVVPFLTLVVIRAWQGRRRGTGS